MLSKFTQRLYTNILLLLQINCSEHKHGYFLPVDTLAVVSIRLQFGTTASQTSIHSFCFQCLSLYSGVALSYSAGLFCTSVIILSLSQILTSRSMTIYLERQTKTGGRAVVLPLVRASRYVPLCSIATANRCAATAPQPHRTANEACCVWKTAAVKQPSVRSLPFKTERFIPTAGAAVSPLRQKTARAR